MATEGGINQYGIAECAVCGKLFPKRSSRNVYCDECVKEIRLCHKPVDRNGKVRGEEKKPKKAKAQTIAEITRLARLEGLSYGHYVARHSIVGDESSDTK